ncbi:MAG TPA: hypothetical protein VMT37_01635 [Solirubrobacterales bacterium]|nr:hypothetical protein [Solirubrobacterales bacterium]
MSALGKTAIERRFEEIFKQGSGDRSRMQAAKYYLRLSPADLVLPNGERHRSKNPLKQAFIVEPGDSAFVSTRERIAMPRDLLGILGPRFSSAENGVLFFGGMMVDPGYGLDCKDEDGEGQPLSFYIGNISSRPIVLKPETEVIASIAFFEIADPLKAKKDPFSPAKGPMEARKEVLDPAKGHQPPIALGLVQDLGEVPSRLDGLESMVKQVVLLGVVVLVAALLGAITAAIFGAVPSGPTETKTVTLLEPTSGSVHGKAAHHALAHVVTTHSSSEPRIEALALTLAGIVVGAGLLVAIFYFAVAAMRRKAGLDRARRLRQP